MSDYDKTKRKILPNARHNILSVVVDMMRKRDDIVSRAGVISQRILCQY